MKKSLVYIFSVGLFLSFTAPLFSETTNWDVSLWGKRRAFTEHVEKLAELVSEKTNGDFTLNISYGGLSKPRENLDGISIGAFEMAQFCAGYHRDKNPTITVLELPFLGVSTLDEEVAVSHAVYNHPATKADLARWNAMLLMTSPMPQYNLAGVGQPWQNLDDFDGKRVRATGGIGQALKSVGAIPTSMTATEIYNAMESGVIDAAAAAQHAHLSFRTIDLADWWTDNLNPGTVNCPVVVNIDAYNALPAKHRQVLNDSVDEAIEHYLDNYNALLQKWENLLDEKGIQKVSLAADELAAFKATASVPIRDAWLQSMAQQGIPGQDLYNLVQTTLNNVRAK